MADHFSKLAVHYAASRPHYPVELFSWLASQCPEQAQAWDCGTGNGQAATALAEHFTSVLASDISQAQLNLAPTHANIRYLCADAAHSQLAQHSVDLIVVAQALHWFNLDSFYAEAKRVLKPSGLIAVGCYGTPQISHPQIELIFQDFYHNIVGAYWPAERSHVENGYASLPFPFNPIPTPDFVLEVNWSLAELLGYVQSWSATGHFIEDKSYNPVDALGEALAALWPQQQRVVWAISLRVGKM
ncbi:class I SAM-dependent methyltransferase [Iodobacter sp. CM08]|uniref:class I SAM-dependent methyltransferase n=1 Tax=Iodobacter sp. CM08 TaxID=3085902 RepID=UPI002981A6CB|nr:class I SAM-dependent methyltransferase [Iodobacter sp. CM08]MDW5418973.1 class I SAM-dependent methyltransferase [Iodobacter sp. CM08]